MKRTRRYHYKYIVECQCGETAETKVDLLFKVNTNRPIEQEIDKLEEQLSVRVGESKNRVFINNWKLISKLRR